MKTENETEKKSTPSPTQGEKDIQKESLGNNEQIPRKHPHGKSDEHAEQTPRKHPHDIDISVDKIKDTDKTKGI